MRQLERSISLTPTKRKEIIILASLILFISGLAFTNLAQQTSPPPINTEKIRDNIYLIKGGAGANCYLITGKRTNLLVDAKMNENTYREMLSEIKKVSDLPLSLIILTHSDGDHINGLAGISGDIRILAHQKTYEEMLPLVERTPELKRILPSETYEGSRKIDFEGTGLELKNFGPAHTSGDTIIFIPASRVAIVGDLMFFGRDPLIHKQKNGSFYGYLKTLENLLDYKPEIEIFLSGHADAASRDQVGGLLNDLKQKEKKVRELMDQGKSLEEIKAAMGVPATPGRWPSLVEIIYQEIRETMPKN